MAAMRARDRDGSPAGPRPGSPGLGAEHESPGPEGHRPPPTQAQVEGDAGHGRGREIDGSATLTSVSEGLAGRC